MSTTVINLGQIAGLIKSSSSPSNTSILWFDTTVGVLKYFDATSTWVPLTASASTTVEDSLTSASTTHALSAHQGKVLNDAITSINLDLRSNNPSLQTIQNIVDSITTLSGNLSSLAIANISGLSTALNSKQAQLPVGTGDGQVLIYNSSTSSYNFISQSVLFNGQDLKMVTNKGNVADVSIGTKVGFNIINPSSGVVASISADVSQPTPTLSISANAIAFVMGLTGKTATFDNNGNLSLPANLTFAGPLTDGSGVANARTLIVDQSGKILTINGGPNNVQSTKSITYANLVTLINSSGLIAGQSYLITDYQTNYVDYDSYNGGTGSYSTSFSATIEPLLVTAITSNVLSQVAKSVLFPNDVIHYSVSNFGIMGGLPQQSKGVIFYRKDSTKNIETSYDFRGAKFKNSSVYGGDNNFYYSFQNANTVFNISILSSGPVLSPILFMTSFVSDIKIFDCSGTINVSGSITSVSTLTCLNLIVGYINNVILNSINLNYVGGRVNNVMGDTLNYNSTNTAGTINPVLALANITKNISSYLDSYNGQKYMLSFYSHTGQFQNGYLLAYSGGALGLGAL